jgi:hypothetical protein
MNNKLSNTDVTTEDIFKNVTTAHDFFMIDYVLFITWTTVKYLFMNKSATNFFFL